MGDHSEREVGGFGSIENFTTPNKAYRKSRSVPNKAQKARTPSGQVISTSVKDIRNFFLTGNENYNRRLHDYTGKSHAPMKIENSQDKLSAKSAKCDNQWEHVKG